MNQSFGEWQKMKVLPAISLQLKLSLFHLSFLDHGSDFLVIYEQENLDKLEQSHLIANIFAISNFNIVVEVRISSVVQRR